MLKVRILVNAHPVRRYRMQVDSVLGSKVLGSRVKDQVFQRPSV